MLRRWWLRRRNKGRVTVSFVIPAELWALSDFEMVDAFEDIAEDVAGQVLSKLMGTVTW